MNTPRAEVKNAADPEQVSRAGRREHRRDDLRLDLYRAVLHSAAGRAVFWDLLTLAGVYRSIYAADGRIHYNAGRQDFGHEVIATLLAADEDAYLLMEREARQLAKRDAVEVDASHTPRAVPTGESEM